VKSLQNLSYKTLFTILFFALAGIVFFLKIGGKTTKVSAAWWNESWQYRRSISISNSSGSNQTNIQVKILNSYDLSSLISAGKIQSDLDDLRFTDSNNNLINYWIEDSTNSSVDIWAIIPILSSSGNNIWMYYGNSNATSVSSSTNITIGGTMVSSTGYRTHIFKGGGTLSNAIDTTAEVLVVGGGGGGGDGVDYANNGGGGGAGGLIYNASFSILAGTYPIAIGNGGARNTNGQNSVFSSLTAIGGGKGATSAGAAGNGGSGGGACPNQTNKGTGTSGQGYNGGNGATSSPWAAGGGGGASELGNTDGLGLGGDGISYSISGSAIIYAGGGSGGNDASRLAGGDGGGGSGAVYSDSSGGGDGVANTGSGGGGGASRVASLPGGAGGSGIVIIRYTSYGTASTPNALEEVTPSPIAYWKFDEGVGTTAYDSAGSNNGVFGTGSSAPTWANESQCISGKCLSFDGTNDYISIANNSNIDFYGSNKPLTLSAWIKVNNPTSNSIIISKGTYPTYEYRFAISTDYKMAFSVNDNGTFKEVFDNVAIDNQWHFWSGVYNGSSISIYKDGVLINSLSHSGVVTQNTANLWIGQYSGGSYALNGLIDEPKIYPYARTSAQIKNDYNSRGSINSSSVNLGSNTQNIGGTITSTKYCIPGDTSYCATPIAEYNFEENTGTVAKDTSGNNNNGTFGTGNSAPSWTTGQNNKGYGLSFDGNDDYVATSTMNNSFTTTAFSLSGWIKTTDTNVATVVRTTNPGDIGLVVDWDSLDTANGSNKITCGGINGTVWNTGEYVTSTSIVNDGIWHFVACTYDSSYYKIYIDGKLNNSAAVTNPPNSPGSSQWYIGRYPPSALELFTGQIDNVKIYNYARTSAQVAYDYNQHHPISYWKFNEGTGTTAYDSAGSNNGIFGTGSSAPTWANDSQCVSGKCLSFDGTNDYLNMGNSSAITSSTSQKSISAWIKVTGGESTWRTVIAPSSSDLFHFQIQDTNKLQIYFYGPSKEALSTTLFNSSNFNKWFYITAVWDGAYAKIYINGIEENRSTAGSGSLTSATSNLYVGNGYNLIRPFNGQIDEVKVYNTALTTDEIKQDYNLGSAIKFGSTTQTIGATTTSLNYCIPGDTSYCATPIAEYNFEENTGTVASDTSGNNNNGTFGTGSSAPTWSSGHSTNSNGVSFDGTNDYIQINNLNSTPTSYTISFWGKRNTISNSYAVVLGLTSPYKNAVWIYENGNIAFGDANGTWASWNSVWTDKNNFHHIEITIPTTGASNTATLYFDGVNKGNITTNSSGTLTSSRIGTFSTVSVNHFIGILDDIKIYNYARTSAQVAYDYNRGKPIAQWKFDECQGSTVYNSSGIGSTGVIIIGSTGTQNSLGTCQIGTSAAWTNGASGKFNSSLNFDGTDDYINTSDQSLQNNSPFSYSVWIKFSTSQLARMIIGRHNDATGGSFLGIDDSSANKIKFGLNSYATQHLNSTMTLNDNTWHHIVGSWDGTNLKLYIDSVLNASSTPTTTLTYPAINTQIGRWVGGASQYFNGQIDDVRIYSYALTTEQIKQVYNGGAVNFQ